jgi:hypothetical protein
LQKLLARETSLSLRVGAASLAVREGAEAAVALDDFESAVNVIVKLLSFCGQARSFSFATKSA